jgi:hypothetical protein
VDSIATYSFDEHRWREFRARYVIDATELGVLLPILQMEYVQRAESRAETGEPHARDKADPNDAQSITYPFVLKRDEHASPLARPAQYEEHKIAQPYSFTIDYGRGKKLTYQIFEKAQHTPGIFLSLSAAHGCTHFRTGRESTRSFR